MIGEQTVMENDGLREMMLQNVLRFRQNFGNESGSSFPVLHFLYPLIESQAKSCYFSELSRNKE